jgi:hypothetical protein
MKDRSKQPEVRRMIDIARGNTRGGVLGKSGRARQAPRKTLPTVCDDCYQQLMGAIQQAAKHYPFAGIYCPHEKRLCLVELENGAVLGFHLIGPIEQDHADELIDGAFETAVPPGSSLILPPGKGE